jgi:hypothetical protein
MKGNKHYMWQSVKGTTRIDIDETPPKPNLTHKIKIIQQGLINYIKNIIKN